MSSGLPDTPSLDAGQEAWVDAYRRAWGAYSRMSKASDYLAERWALEMADAYLIGYRIDGGSAEGFSEIKQLAQKRGKIFPERPSPEKAKRPAVVESTPLTGTTKREQIDIFETEGAPCEK